MKLRHISQPYM